jgi:tRNA(Ile)-lysidine synthase
MALLHLTLIERVAENIDRRQMLASAKRIGVAVSGGADSVVVLHILHRLRSRFAYELLVLHVNHHLRGAESDADESFVRGLAQELGLPCTVEQATAPGHNSEQQTREIRRAYFRRAFKDHSLQRIALGHTRSDQAETVLFRLLRGTGLSGIAGMRPVSTDGLMRPLLLFSREELRAWASSEGVAWRDDSSNLDVAFTRNRLRLDTLPALAKTYNPNLERILAQSAELAQTEEDYWNEQVCSLYPQIEAVTRFGLVFEVGTLAASHFALRRRILRHAIQQIRGDLRGIEYEHVESVTRLCENEQGHDRVIIPGVDALRSYNRLLLAREGFRDGQQRDYRIDLEVGGEYQLPFRTGLLSLHWLKSDDPECFCVNFKEEQDETIEVCDWDGDILAGTSKQPSLCVRNWRPGDHFQRLGHQSGEKIKTLFQIEKVLLWERKHWPVVLAGEEIVWVRQFGGSARVSASTASRKVIRLIYRRT